MANEKIETGYLTGIFHLKNGKKVSEIITGNVTELKYQKHCIESVLRKEPGWPVPTVLEFGDLYVIPEEICAAKLTVSTSLFEAAVYSFIK